MFNIQILFSQMGFIWSLLKSRGFCLICKTMRLKSQEEVSKPVNPVFLLAEVFSGGTCSCCVREGKGVALSERFRDADSRCGHPSSLGLALGSPWLLPTREVDP